MIDVRELLDDVGRRNLTLAGCLFVLVGVFGNRYVDSLEKAITKNTEALRVLELRQERDDSLHTKLDGGYPSSAGLRLENALKDHEKRKWHRQAGEEISRLKTEVENLKNR